MSNHHRCPICAHRPGPRSTNNLAKLPASPHASKKPSCGCACHRATTPETTAVAGPVSA